MANQSSVHSGSAKRTGRSMRRFTARVLITLLVALLVAATGPGALPAAAQADAPEQVQVLVADLTETTAADFGRGQARGVGVAGEDARASLLGQTGEFVSGPIALPFAATHLGLHWIIRNAEPESVQVAVRTGANAHTWSEWYPVTIEASEEVAAGTEVFAALAPGDRARLAQYRVTFGAAKDVTLDAMTVTALKSVDGPHAAVAGQPAAPVALSSHGQSVSVITRAGWGCDESARFSRTKRSTTEKWPEMYVPAKKIIIHHTATANDYVDGAAEVRAIYTYHTQTLGWGDIGYNVLVDNRGNIYEGRHGRGEAPNPQEVLGDDVVAGHALAYNYGSLGIAAIGNASSATPPDAMLNALVNVAAYESARELIDPLGVSDFLRSDDVWHPALSNIAGHNEVNSTECPGTNLTAWLPVLRQTVADRLNMAGMSGAPALTANVTSGTALAVGAKVTFNAAGVTSWSLEGWYKAPRQESISYLSGYALDPYYSDLGAQTQTWTPGTWAANEVTFTKAGHYTLHVRAEGYEANLTFFVKGRR